MSQTTIRHRCKTIGSPMHPAILTYARASAQDYERGCDRYSKLAKDKHHGVGGMEDGDEMEGNDGHTTAVRTAAEPELDGEGGLSGLRYGGSHRAGR